MTKISRDLLGVLTQSPRGESPAQHPLFDCAVECAQALLEFNLISNNSSFRPKHRGVPDGPQGNWVCWRQDWVRRQQAWERLESQSCI